MELTLENRLIFKYILLCFLMESIPKICIEREYRNGKFYQERYLSLGGDGKVVRECDSLKNLAYSIRYAIISENVEELRYRNMDDNNILISKDGEVTTNVRVKIRKGLNDQQLEELVKYIYGDSFPSEEYLNLVLTWRAGCIANRR